MALPSSGQFSFGQINVELGRSSTTQISMNETAVRTLFGAIQALVKRIDTLESR